jgi:hypothetical protein
LLQQGDDYGREGACGIHLRQGHPINQEKLIPEAVVWNAEDFLRYAKECKICLFI